MAKATIGFIGLGDMGTPMSRRLLLHGWPVVGCARARRENLEALKADGLEEAATPRAVAATSEVVIIMVRDEPAAHGAVLGDEGALAGMGEGTTLVIMSTLNPDFCRRVAAAAAPRQVAVLDAPVSGFPFRAEEGTLAIMVGGDPEIFDRCRPLLETMGQPFACGGVGMGMVTKLANNVVAVGTMALVAEARALAQAYGMPPDQLMAIFEHSSASSFVVQNWAAIATMWDHVVSLGEKDLGIFLEAAGHHDLDTPLAVAISRYRWSD